jgi:hypothetical protein
VPLFTVCGLIGPLKVKTTGVVNVAIVAPDAGFAVTVGSVEVVVPFVLNVLVNGVTGFPFTSLKPLTLTV